MAIILIPGIKGSKLADTYPSEFQVRWSLEDMVVGDVFEDLLDFELRDGLYDRSDVHLFREWELINFAYERMVKRLRAWVDRRLYTFPYDWRKPLDASSERLLEFMEHVQAKLARDGEPTTLSFVTHSMGGLLLRSALERRRPNPLRDVERIVFIAPPFRGACDIPKALIAGERNGWLGEDEDSRRVARSFPSVYQLVPSFDRATVDAGTGAELDLFASGSWQQNVVEGREFQPRLLANAEAFVRAASARHGGESPAPMISESFLRRHADKILVLMSVGCRTVLRIPVKVDNPPNRNWFDFTSVLEDERGDGRVHLKSAAVRGLTLAAYRGAAGHALVCRDRLIINSTSAWLQEGRLVKMTPRTPRLSHNRRRSRFFEPWDGREASFGEHVV
jgi:predicted alpha/beta hydrolase family esterase